jgi:hypothetical protein
VRMITNRTFKRVAALHVAIGSHRIKTSINACMNMRVTTCQLGTGSQILGQGERLLGLDIHHVKVDYYTSHSFRELRGSVHAQACQGRIDG